MLGARYAATRSKPLPDLTVVLRLNGAGERMDYLILPQALFPNSEHPSFTETVGRRRKRYRHDTLEPLFEMLRTGSVHSVPMATSHPRQH